MSVKWTPIVAETYNPIEIGSIDGTDVLPHDRAIVRALNSTYQWDPFQVKSNPKQTLFVCRLHLKTKQDTLEHVFSKYGKIVSCRLVRDFITGISKGYAFIEFETVSEAYNAIKYANGLEIHGKKILVDFECERNLKGWIPRRLGGGFGGDKGSGQLRFGCKDRPFKKPIV